MKRVGLLFGLAVSSVVWLQLQAAEPVPPPQAQVIQEVTLRRTSLTTFGYSQQELEAAQPRGLVVFDRPAIGSGLIAQPFDWYLGITDRGPNIDHFPTDAACQPTGGANGKTFPLPQFTPAIVRFRAQDGELWINKVTNLVTPNGAPVTGLTNMPGDDLPFDHPCSSTPIAFNENGMDVEDFALLPNGLFVGVEENNPSFFVGEVKSGVVRQRYTPLGKTLPAAGYSVSDTLPAVLSNRRNNRGFEAIAVTPDGQTAYTMTQSPLGSTASGSPYRDSRVLRILKLDVSDPFNVNVTGQFVFLVSSRSVYTTPPQNSINQRDLKLSAMAWVGPNKLLLLERSDESNRGGVRLILVDLAGATNIHGTAVADTLTPEDVATNLASLGITPVTSSVVFEEYQHQANRRFWTYKLEGLAIKSSNVVAIINDNDFGIADVIDAPTTFWRLRLASHLQ